MTCDIAVVDRLDRRARSLNAGNANREERL